MYFNFYWLSRVLRPWFCSVLIFLSPLTVSLATFFQSVWSQWRRGNGLSVSSEHDVANGKWHHRSAWLVVYSQRRDFWTGESTRGVATCSHRRTGALASVICFCVILVLCLNIVITQSKHSTMNIASVRIISRYAALGPVSRKPRKLVGPVKP